MSESDSDEHGRLASLASSGTNGLGSLGGSDADDVASTVAAADLDDERPLLLIFRIPRNLFCFFGKICSPGTVPIHTSPHACSNISAQMYCFAMKR